MNVLHFKSKRKKATLIRCSLIIGIVAVCLVTSFYLGTLATKRDCQTTPTITEGRIVGNMSYPSEGVPSDVQVYAVDTTTGHVYRGRRFGMLVYEIIVPFGQYHVFSYKPAGGLPASLSSAYTNYSQCGNNVSCGGNHDLIPVDIDEKIPLAIVNPSDWYAPVQTQNQWPKP